MDQPGIFSRLWAAIVPTPAPAPQLRADSGPAPEPTRGDSVYNPRTGLGMANDKGAAARPNVTRVPLSPGECDTLYRFNAYARKYVELLPSEGVRKGWKINDETQDTDPLATEANALHMRARVWQAAVWARVHGGALIVPVLEEDVPAEFMRDGRIDEAWYQQPLELERVRAVKNLIVVDRYAASAIRYEGDLESPNFLGVKLWQITPQAAAGIVASRVYHESRVIQFRGAELSPSLRTSNSGFDDSVFQASWDPIRNLTSMEQVGATLAQELNIAVFKINSLQGRQLSDQAALFDARMTEIAIAKSVTRSVILELGEEYSNLGSNVSGFNELHEAAKTSYSAATGIPQVVAFGEAPGGLNTDGESHRNLMAQGTSAWQVARLEEPLTKLYRMLFWATTRGEPETWKVEFLPLNEPTATEDATVRATTASTDAVYITNGVLTPDEVRASRFGKDGYQTEILPVEGEAPEPEPQDEQAPEVP